MTRDFPRAGDGGLFGEAKLVALDGESGELAGEVGSSEGRAGNYNKNCGHQLKSDDPILSTEY
jgi:hypothetical protein